MSVRIFDNRELALLFWLAALLIWGFASKRMRPSLVNVANIEPFVPEPVRPGRHGEHGEHGAGLGLAIVRAVAEAHGGSVTLENPPTGGALVTVVLRVPEPPGDALPRGSVRTAAPGRGGGAP